MRSFKAMQREHIESGIIHAELGDPPILVINIVRYHLASLLMNVFSSSMCLR